MFPGDDLEPSFEEVHPERDMPGPTKIQLSMAHKHIQNFDYAPCHPEPKNPISLLLEVGQKLHVTPRYYISKPKHSAIYTCEVRFYGYKAKSSSEWKKISKQEAAKDLLDQIVSDAKRKAIQYKSNTSEWIAEEETNAQAVSIGEYFLKKRSMVPRSTTNQSQSLQGVEPFLQFAGEIHYILNKKDCRVACQEIRQSSDGPVICGFDIEWKPNYIRGQDNQTAIIQICPSEEDCFVFQVSALDCIPFSLKNLLEDNQILKAGVGIKGDVSKIRTDFGIRLANTVDLSQMYNKVIGSRRVWGIKSLLQKLLKKTKDDSETLSNWEDSPLAEEQLMYAATDAYAGLLLYHKINAMPSGNKLRTGGGVGQGGNVTAGGNTTYRRRNRNGRSSIVSIIRKNT